MNNENNPFSLVPSKKRSGFSNELQRPHPLFLEEASRIKQKNGLPASFSQITEMLVPDLRAKEHQIVERFGPKKRRNSFWTDNYGAIMESIYIMLIIFGFILASLIALKIGSGFFNDPAYQTISNQSNVGNATMANWNRIDNGGTMDAMILGFYFGSHILMIILSALIPLNIIFFVFNLLFMIVGLVIASSFQSFLVPMLVSFGTTNIPMTLWLGRHMVPLEVAFIAVMIIVMVIANRGRA